MTRFGESFEPKAQTGHGHHLPPSALDGRATIDDQGIPFAARRVCACGCGVYLRSTSGDDMTWQCRERQIAQAEEAADRRQESKERAERRQAMSAGMIASQQPSAERVAMLALLANGPLTARQIAARVGMTSIRKANHLVSRCLREGVIVAVGKAKQDVGHRTTTVRLYGLAAQDEQAA